MKEEHICCLGNVFGVPVSNDKMELFIPEEGCEMSIPRILQEDKGQNKGQKVKHNWIKLKVTRLRLFWGGHTNCFLFLWMSFSNFWNVFSYDFYGSESIELSNFIFHNCKKRGAVSEIFFLS